MASTNPRSRSRIGWTGSVGIALAVVLLWWTLHDIELADLVGHMRSARMMPFLACVVVATVVFPLRTVRWRYLLRLDGAPLPFLPMWHATAIGFMVNNLLPARVGEVARPYAASRLTGVRFTTAVGSLAVERVMDGLTLVAMLAAAMVASGFEAETTVGAMTFGHLMALFGVAFTMALVAGIVAVRRPEWAVGTGRWVAHLLLPAAWADKVVHLLEGLFEGLDALREWRRFAVVSFWSVIVWGTNGVSFWLCMVAFGLDVPWSAAYVLQSLIAFAVAFPAAPGFFGVFEFVTRATLTLYAVPASLAVSYAFGYHLFTFLPITVLGLWSLYRGHLHLGDLGRGGAPGGGGD